VAKSPSLLTEVPFGAFLVYAPRGTTEQSKLAKEICYGVKFDRPGMIADVVSRLVSSFAETDLSSVLGRDVTLVPSPRSTPLVKGALWPAQRVAQELVASGLGREVLSSVTRREAVPKSAFARAGERPTPQQHLDSLAVRSELAAAHRITVVDDVITRGSTTIAVASLLKHHFPESDVRVFAMVRTMSYQPEVAAPREPTTGIISINSRGDAIRTP
jgi:predicted amidophosphoribosyltransferase